jgi:hypothetical protein
MSEQDQGKETKAEQTGQPDPTLVIVYNPRTQQFAWTFTGVIPHAGLVNALEMIKTLMVQTQLMNVRPSQPQKRVLLPDGSPQPPGM